MGGYPPPGDFDDTSGPTEPPPTPYRLRVKIGDRVRMPDARLGTVVDFDFPTAPHFLRVFVRPDKPTTGWRRFLPVFTRRFVEEEIDALVPVTA